jgi:glycosyltransferase involved in cell wall biosynthesis
MLKVLHLITGNARSPYLCAIADHTDRSRFEVIVGSLAGEGPLHEEMRAKKVRTVALGCETRARYPLAVWRLARWLRRERADVLQTHLFDASLVGLVAARLAGTPVAVFTGHHSHEVPMYRKRLPLWLDALCARWLAHWISAPSAQMKEMLVENQGAPASKIVVLPYPFELARIAPRPAGTRERIRAELGLGGGPVVGAIGRLFWVKNYPCLLRAFARVAAQFPAVKLLVIGDGAERERLRQECAERGIAGRVVFAGYRADVLDVLEVLDVFVHPSLAESFGQVIVEAFALGKPVVSTDVGIARDLVRDGLNGFLVPPGDADALARALETLLRSPQCWAGMGEEGRLAVQQFAAERMVRQYEEHYVKWLAKSRGQNALGPLLPESSERPAGAAAARPPIPLVG